MKLLLKYFFLIVSFTWQFANGTNIYVSPSGNDANLGTPSAPKATVSEA